MPVNESTKSENELKKAFLRQYAECVRRINRIDDELDGLRFMKMCPSAKQSDGMPHGHGGVNDLSGYAVELEMLEEMLRAERYKRMKAFEKISEQINKLEDQNESDVLFYRYIRQLDWWKIAERMNYSDRWIYKLHGKALMHLELPKEFIEVQ